MTPTSSVRRRIWRIAVCLVAVAGVLPATAAAADPLAGPFQRYGVVAWGFNDGGQLGDGTNVASASPVTTIAPAGAMKQVSAGDRFALALDNSGRVWSWGENTDGQLGDGTTVSRKHAALIPGLTGIQQISAGDGFALALDGQSQVWSWGANHHGQLGDGTTVSRPTPVRLSTLPPAYQVAAGGRHALAVIGLDVYSWGDNSFGQLGNGTRVSRPSPARVQVTDIVWSVSAGRFTSFAVPYAGGSLLSWGSNSHGQIGNGTFFDQLVPEPVFGPSGLIRQVAASATHTLMLLTDGTVKAWGDNAQGQLGDGTLVNRSRPVTTRAVPGTVVEIAAGGMISMSRRSDGRVYQWGLRPGPGYPHEMYAIPSGFPNISGAISIDAGGDAGGSFSLAVKNIPLIFEPLGERP